MKLKKIFLTCLAIFFIYSNASSQLCQIVGTTNLYPYSDGCVQSYSIAGTVTLKKLVGFTWTSCGGIVDVALEKETSPGTWGFITSVSTSSSFFGLGLAPGSSAGNYRIHATNPGNCSCAFTSEYISATIVVNSSVTAPTFVVGQKYDATNYNTVSASTTCSSPFTNICPVYSAPYSYMMTAVNSTIPWYQVANGQWSCKLEEVPVGNCAATPSLIFNTSYATIGSMSSLDNIDLNALAVTPGGFPANYISTSKRYKFTLNIKYTCEDVFTYTCWLRYTTAGCRISSEQEESSEALDNSISLFPNPVNDILEIKTNNTIQSVILTDVSGKEIKAELKNNTVDFSKISAGVYTIKVYTNDGVSIKKVVKQD